MSSFHNNKHDSNDDFNKIGPLSSNLFALHLAMELLGTTTVLNHLRCLIHEDETNRTRRSTTTVTIATTSSTFHHHHRPLYWRSSLLWKDPSFATSTMTMVPLDNMMDALYRACPPPHVMLLDITFDFVKITENDSLLSVEDPKHSTTTPTSSTTRKITSSEGTKRMESQKKNEDDDDDLNQYSHTTIVTASLGVMMMMRRVEDDQGQQNEDDKGTETASTHFTTTSNHHNHPRQINKNDDDNNNKDCVVKYLATQGLNDIKQLHSHIQSLHLDPQTVTNKSLASVMAKELRSLGPTTTSVAAGTNDDNDGGGVTATISPSSNNSKSNQTIVNIYLPYRHSIINAVGEFTLILDETKSTILDAPSMRLLSLWDGILMRNYNTNNNNIHYIAGQQHNIKGLRNIQKNRRGKEEKEELSSKEEEQQQQQQVLEAWNVWNSIGTHFHKVFHDNPCHGQATANTTMTALSTSVVSAKNNNNNNESLVAKRKMKGRMAAFGGRKTKQQRKGLLVFDNDDNDDE